MWALGKAILFPFLKPKKQRILVRLSGLDKYVEEYLTYGGESEWIELILILKHSTCR